MRRKISRITHKNIKPYGQIIDSGCAKTQSDGSGWGILVRSRSSGWRIAYLILKKRKMSRLESHPDTLETFEPVKGKAVIALAPRKYPERLKYFYLDKPIVLNKSVWHALATISKETHMKIFENIKVKCVYRKLKTTLLALTVFATLASCSGCLFAASQDKKGPAFSLYYPGTEDIVDYERYGKFIAPGTFEYKYKMTDKEGLAKASGEGIDPNMDVTKDPVYIELKNAGRLKGGHWEHIGTKDLQADFFVWATAYKENPGVRLYFTGRALEAAGLYVQALKAYRAAMILYPDAACWNKSATWTWLIGPASWSAAINLIRMHPELDVKLSGAYVVADAAIGGDPAKNRVAITPGKMIRYTEEGRKRDSIDIMKLKVVERRGGRVACVKYENGQWGMEVDGKPFFVKGMQYSPTRVGMDYKWNWMEADEDGNGSNDVAYQAWVDKNGNNKRDEDEALEGDFKLLKDMGCNTIRIFNTYNINKELLRDLSKRYGIKVFILDPLGAYTVHSGADWAKGTDYNSEEQRKRMMDFVRKTVIELKDEEWLLGYILGNENNMSCDYTGVNASRTRASSQPEIYAKFLNDVAAMVHSLDPEHPVGIGNMGLGLVEYYAKYAPEIDFIGVNDYPGSYGFGSLWTVARRMIDRPILITEFGCDAYATEIGPDEESQAIYLKNAWEDIVYNSAGNPGEGNSIGGIVFEWLDEWWKDTRGDPLGTQSEEPTFEMAFPDGYSQEEWIGIVGQGSGGQSPFLRSPRKSYYMLKELWLRSAH